MERWQGDGGVGGGDGGGEWELSASPPDNDVCSLALPFNPITVPTQPRQPNALLNARALVFSISSAVFTLLISPSNLSPKRTSRVSRVERCATT